MRFGCVTSEVGRIQSLADMGYDYVELGFRALAPLEDDLAFATIRERILEAPLKPEAFCAFIPRFVGLKIVGPGVDRSRNRRYAETMLDRAAQVGARVAVFGCGPARSVPEGFPAAKALDQLREFLTLFSELATARGIKPVLEPLNRGETNLVNGVDEAVKLVQSLGKTSLRTMVDYYHLMADDLPLEQVRQAGPLICHVHTSDANRLPPGSDPNAQAELLAILRALGYDGRLSVECRFGDFEREAAAALQFLREAWRRVSEGS